MDEHETFYEAAENFLNNLVGTEFDLDELELRENLSLVPEAIVQLEDIEEDWLTCVAMVSKSCLNENFEVSERQLYYGIIMQPKDELWINANFSVEYSDWDINAPHGDDLQGLTLMQWSEILNGLVQRYDNTA